jgi:hypothetical protein
MDELLRQAVRSRAGNRCEAMNDPDRIALRQELLAQGLLPRE